MFRCCSLETSHPLLLPQSLKDCSINLCLFFFSVLHIELLLTISDSHSCTLQCHFLSYKWLISIKRGKMIQTDGYSLLVARTLTCSLGSCKTAILYYEDKKQKEPVCWKRKYGKEVETFWLPLVPNHFPYHVTIPCHHSILGPGNVPPLDSGIPRHNEVAL